MKHACAGQNTTNEPSAHAVARCSLEGDALCVFDIKARDGTETLENFEKCLQAVAKDTFPKCATQAQKRYSHCTACKPSDVGACECTSGITEIANFLKDFLSEVETNDEGAEVVTPETKFPAEYKTLDLLKCGVLAAW